jgi:glycosidase
MRSAFFSVVLVAAVACNTDTGKTSTPAAAAKAAPAEWTKSAAIYEINVRQYTPAGTFAALQKELPRLDSLGVDILWLMPVQPIGVKNRKGPLGSYYSIRDYTAINPEFGTQGDAKSFIDAAHAAGFRVVLDWVANHTAFDHPWITAHPDWYVHHADGSISNARDGLDKETDWTDVAELNYDNASLRGAMIDAMRFWVDTMHIDGFRADVAGGVPMEFWSRARAELTAARPDLFFLAEADGPQYHPVFDATYGWEFHHLLNDVAKRKQPVAALDAYLAKDSAAFPSNAYRMYFTSNHDENSWSGSEFERMGANHLPAFVLSATLRQSMPLVYTGQEASLSRKLRFFEKDTVQWNGPSLASFYSTMIKLKHNNGALWNGDAGGTATRLTTTGSDAVYAFTRTRDTNTVLVAVNFGDAAARAAYTGLARPGSFTDWFSKAAVTLGAAGTIDVPAHGYRVLVR